MIVMDCDLILMGSNMIVNVCIYIYVTVIFRMYMTGNLLSHMTKNVRITLLGKCGSYD